MNLYFIARWLLFRLPAETAHKLALQILQLITHFWQQKLPLDFVHIAGLDFPNRLGIAAGLDKNADYVDALLKIGAGHLEIGAITPQPQIGNPKPRLFRLAKQRAVINRMGFNNKGVDYVVKKLQTRKSTGIVGANIGKNKDTPLENAHQDYVICIEKLYAYVDYFSINISSPNTPGLRELQTKQFLGNLLTQVVAARNKLTQQTQKRVPLFVKLSPDLSKTDLQETVDVLLAHEIDGVIATNTTLQRPGVESSALANEVGGLSGRPLFPLSLALVRQLDDLLKGRLPIIAVGGIDSVERAHQMFAAGASLIQLYSGLTYSGPQLLRKIAQNV